MIAEKSRILSENHSRTFTGRDYGKSGFDRACRSGIRYNDLPEDADSSFFLCRELIRGYLSGITGVYVTPRGYFVDEAAAEEFDRNFPQKEKLRLKGQLF